MQSASRQCAVCVAPGMSGMSDMLAGMRWMSAGLAVVAAAIVGGAATAQCITTCPPGAVVANDGCDDPDDLVNGGCNLDTPSFDQLGALSPATPRVYCGQVGTFGANTRDLDWARFTLSQPATVTVSVAHKDLATGNPAPNITVFVLDGDDCATNQIVVAAVSGACPFVNSVVLPAGAHLVVVTVNAFAPDGPACPVDFVATLTAAFGQFVECGDPLSGDCAKVHATGGCSDFECCEQVCGFNPGCCEDGWDENCLALAIKFCDSVKVGDDPIAVQSRATHSGAIPSSPTWVPWESQPRTLEVLFKGGIPLSAHGCRIQASERVTSAVYFHTR